MRLQQASAIVLISVSYTKSFTPCFLHHTGLSRFTATRTPIRNNVLYSSAAQEFIARQKEAEENAEEEEEEQPVLFSEEIYKDIQDCLLTLEHRVQEGPGCFDNKEVDEFAMAAGRILNDMKKESRTLPTRIQPGERQSRAEAAAIEAAKAADQKGKTSEEVEAIAKKAYDDAQKSMIPPPSHTDLNGEATSSSPLSNSESPSIQPVTAAREEGVVSIDHNEEEGSAYDGTGGMGLAKGTANTYDIPGMDEMTADEYQKALSQAVIDRAAKRRYGMGGRHGNQQTNDYMASLSTGGDYVNPFDSKKDDTDTKPGKYENDSTNDYMASLMKKSNPFDSK